ncbi:hypothetical protein BpHYR1_053203 [Brachionus plicatilis]|uniref:Uncharacterized protein n=1 Tax=Brachionus plicatilis TaxID=10195 RepID=A0A3M7PWH7_BRAPC|nr:hypothetical protein BpHYR1_053203 [Brachionus plicatilis]
MLSNFNSDSSLLNNFEAYFKQFNKLNRNKSFINKKIDFLEINRPNKNGKRKGIIQNVTKEFREGLPSPQKQKILHKNN